MKKITQLILFLIFHVSLFAQGQTRDSITLQDLKPYSYDFSITDGEITGEGATVLKEALSNTQVTMLGVDGRTKLEAELTQAFINLLNQEAYKTIVLEAGPASGEVIRKLSKDPTSTIQNIKNLNQRYAFDIKDLKIAPIPEVRSIEAAEFIQSAATYNWNILSIGVEYWTGYRMFADELYANLPKSDKQAHRNLYQETAQLLDLLYEEINGQGNEDLFTFTSALKSSKIFNRFLEEMSSYEINNKIVKAIRFSVEYWYMYGNKEFYKKNKLNSAKNKARMAEAFKSSGFDITKDKLFIQMWKNHLVKGTTPNGFYGIGNTLHELAELNGSTSLNIGVVPRYTEEDGVVKDALNSYDYWNKSYKEIIPLGKKEQWVLVDIRPFNEKFHWGPYIISPQMEKVITRFDMIVIPKMNRKATINY